MLVLTGVEVQGWNAFPLKTGVVAAAARLFVGLLEHERPPDRVFVHPGHNIFQLGTDAVRRDDVMRPALLILSV